MNLEQRNNQLEEKLKDSDLTKAVEILIKDAKKRRRQVTILTISVILDIILTAGISYLSIRTHDLASKAESNHEAVVRSCYNSNEARANNSTLWDYLLAAQPKKPLSQEEMKFRDDFVKLKEETFKPRPCNEIK